MRNSVPNGTTELLVQWSSGRLTCSECVDWAVDALVAGIDSVNLRSLAAYPRLSPLSEVESTLKKVITELSIDVPEPEKLLREYATVLALDLLSGRLDTPECLRRIHSMVVTPLEHPPDQMAWCS